MITRNPSPKSSKVSLNYYQSNKVSPSHLQCKLINRSFGHHVTNQRAKPLTLQRPPLNTMRAQRKKTTIPSSQPQWRMQM